MKVACSGTSEFEEWLIQHLPASFSCENLSAQSQCAIVEWNPENPKIVEQLLARESPLEVIVVFDPGREPPRDIAAVCYCLPRTPSASLLLGQAMAVASERAHARELTNTVRGPVRHDLKGVSSILHLLLQVMQYDPKTAKMAKKVEGAQLKLEALIDDVDWLLDERSKKEYAALWEKPGKSQPDEEESPTHPWNEVIRTLAHWSEQVHRGRKCNFENTLDAERSPPFAGRILRGLLDVGFRSSHGPDEVRLQIERQEGGQSVTIDMPLGEDSPLMILPTELEDLCVDSTGPWAFGVGEDERKTRALFRLVLSARWIRSSGGQLHMSAPRGDTLRLTWRPAT